MQIHTVIDDQLFHQAAYLTGVADKRMLLEHALRILIQIQQIHLPHKTDIIQPKSNFWEQLQCFRSSVNLSELGEIDEIFTNVRDKDAGRPVEL